MTDLDSDPDPEPEPDPDPDPDPDSESGDPAEERPTSPFDTLDATKIVETAQRLSRRIH